MPRTYDEPFIAGVCDYEGGVALPAREWQRRRHVFGHVWQWCQDHADSYGSAEAAYEPCKSAILAIIGPILLDAVLSYIIQRVLQHWFG